jgi:hypothetical protein
MRVFPEGPTVQVATAEPGSVSFIKLVRMERARACRSNSLEQSRHRSPGVLHVLPPARQIEDQLRRCAALMEGFRRENEAKAAMVAPTLPSSQNAEEAVA